MRTSYHTQQKAALLRFLEENEHEHLTIDEILSAMGDEAPGKSTAYRLIKKLCDDGLVRRFTRGDNECRVSACGQELLQRASAY